MTNIVKPSFNLWYAGWIAAKQGKDKNHTNLIGIDYSDWESGWNAAL